LQHDLCAMLQQGVQDNARILSYHDLFKIWSLPSYFFKQLDVNCSLADRFPTSWSVQRGHHFFLFKKTSRQGSRSSFQKLIQRSTSSDQSSAFTKKSPSTKRGASTSAAILHSNTHGSLPISSSHNLSEKEYREAQAYAAAFPSLPGQTPSPGAAVVRQHTKVIPQLTGRKGSDNVVDTVDESDCGCSLFPSFLSYLFSSPRKTGKKVPYF
jgi:hypothetical protein